MSAAAAMHALLLDKSVPTAAEVLDVGKDMKET
jgi:hypothetical protein